MTGYTIRSKKELRLVIESPLWRAADRWLLGTRSRAWKKKQIEGVSQEIMDIIKPYLKEMDE